jgi:hypothetical protein
MVEIDESTTPRSLDWRNIELADGQPLPTLRGVYLLESNSLTIRNGSFAGTRPKNFEPGDSVVASRVTFRRPAKAPSAASSALGGERTRR